MKNRPKGELEALVLKRDMDSKSERRWKAWKSIQSVLIISGLSLLAIYGAVRLDNNLNSRAAMDSFTALSANAPSETGSARTVDQSASQSGSPSDGGSLAGSQKKANRIATPMAVLEIPKIQLAVPLLEGTDGRTLSRGVGHIAGTARPGEMGNIGIAGHRDSYFRGLKDIKLGDSIELQTLKGTETYQVDQIDIVEPDDVSVLRPRDAPSLTLVTCYPFHFIGSAPQRYIVRASLMHEKSSGPGSSQPGSASPTSSTNTEEVQ